MCGLQHLSYNFNLKNKDSFILFLKLIIWPFNLCLVTSSNESAVTTADSSGCAAIEHMAVHMAVQP